MNWNAIIYFVVGPDEERNIAFSFPLQEYLEYNGKRCTVLEYPEVQCGKSLWPREQASLARTLLEEFKKRDRCAIILTNSEYIIRASQVIVKEMRFASNTEADANAPFACFCVSEGKGSGVYDIFQDAYSLQYQADGCFANDFCPGFYDAASDLAFQLM